MGQAPFVRRPTDLPTHQPGSSTPWPGGCGISCGPGSTGYVPGARGDDAGGPCSRPPSAPRRSRSGTWASCASARGFAARFLARVFRPQSSRQAIAATRSPPSAAPTPTPAIAAVDGPLEDEPLDDGSPRVAVGLLSVAYGQGQFSSRHKVSRNQMRK